MRKIMKISVHMLVILFARTNLQMFFRQILDKLFGFILSYHTILAQVLGL